MHIEPMTRSINIGAKKWSVTNSGRSSSPICPGSGRIAPTQTEGINLRVFGFPVEGCADKILPSAAAEKTTAGNTVTGHGAAILPWGSERLAESKLCIAEPRGVLGNIPFRSGMLLHAK